MMNIGVPRIRSLCYLSQGETGEIIQVSGKPEIHRYLYRNGLAMGRTVLVQAAESISPDSPLTVQSGGIVSNITRDIAHNIKVRVA